MKETVEAEHKESVQSEVVEEGEVLVSQTEEVAEDSESLKETVAPQEEKKLKKHDKAKVLVQEAKNIVKEAEEQMDACKLLLADDLKAYEEAKHLLKEGGMDASEALLAQLGYVANSDEESEEEESVVFEPNEEVGSMVLRDVSSGRFTGFLYALFGGAATLAGLVYYATKKLGISLDVTKVPSNETLQTIFGWFGTQIGRTDDALNGGLAVGATVLAVMALIYFIRVSLKGNKNLHFATKQLEDAQEYTLHKGSCKEEMDKVDAHIHDAIDTLKKYQVLLNEQKGKLERIVYFEGNTEEENPKYHEKSLQEMKETQELLDAIKTFMALPMSEEGKLSGKSTLFLYRAKNRMNKLLEKLY